MPPPGPADAQDGQQRHRHPQRRRAAPPLAGVPIRQPAVQQEKRAVDADDGQRRNPSLELPGDAAEDAREEQGQQRQWTADAEGGNDGEDWLYFRRARSAKRGMESSLACASGSLGWFFVYVVGF